MLRYRISPQRVLWFIDHLPLDSAFNGAVRGGPEHRAWAVAEYMLANIVDRLAEVAVAAVQPHTKKRVKPPAKFPRPSKGRRGKARVVSLDRLPE